MARYIFGGEITHLTVSEDAANADALVVAPNAEVALSPSRGGAATTDFLLWDSTSGTYAIAATSISSDANGLIPEFQGPDGVTVLYDADGAALVARDLPTEGGGGEGSAIDSYADVQALPGYPATFPPSTHSHPYLTQAAADSRYALIGSTGTSEPKPEILTWHVNGPLSVTGDDIVPVYNDDAEARTIVAVRTQLATGPATTSVLVDVNIDGTTIFGTQSQRPTIAVGQLTSGKRTGMTVTTWPAGSALAPAIDQVGSATAPGEDLIVQVTVR